MRPRRVFVRDAIAALASTLVPPLAAAQSRAARDRLATRAIPGSGERLPVIGLGTSGAFEVERDGAARARLGTVLQRFVAAGARVIDTAPTYTSAEDVVGDLVAAAGQRENLFLATKLSGVRGREEGLAQFRRSQQRLQSRAIDLLQIHNLQDTLTQFEVARALQGEGSVRYIGLTHYVESAHDELAREMKRLRPDFIQINYSPVSRGIERRVLPLAADLGIAVMINRPFEDGRLFTRVAGRAVPEWAAEVGADSWAQLFLKFALSPSAVTVVVPATSKPRNMTDNLRAGYGPMLDERQRARLVAALD